MIFTKFIWAYLLGDFILQPNLWVLDTEKDKLKSRSLYPQIILHSILSFVFFWKMKFWWLTYCIGGVKKMVFQTGDQKKYFFINLVFYMAVIAVISYGINEFNVIFSENKNLLKNEGAILFLIWTFFVFINIQRALSALGGNIKRESLYTIEV